MSNKAKGVILGVLGQLQKSISFDECNRNKTFYDGVKRGIKLSKKAIENISKEELTSKDETIKTDFTFVTSESGDWKALYINDKLAVEGHEVTAKDVLDCIADILPNKVICLEIPQDIADIGMPECLIDLILDYLKT